VTWRLATWNVNSIRARLDHVATWCAEHEPDCLLLQETKVEDALFPRAAFVELGYYVTLHGSKGQAGVATLSREPPSRVQRGFARGPADRHARVLCTTVRGIRLYNLYVPNGTALGSEAFEYKLAWLRRLREELDTTARAEDDLILAGDFNVAPEARDVHDPRAAAGKLLFTDEEHAALRHLVEFGLRDCLRCLDDSSGIYSWFDYRAGAFARGHGMRIDHIYATSGLAARCRAVIHDLEPRGWDTPSDHAPVLATFE
jgi:exodeoxyribonuclease-3